MTSAQLEREIELVLRDRTGRECLFVPSGRLGLYLALRAWTHPGDRLLMSPVNDDVIFFTVLAAGLRPVMAPLSPRDGNIDVDAMPEQTWSSISGVLTTNLYGLPDPVRELRSRCNRLGIPLIEDAAHAIETEVEGQPVGTFGIASAFSFSKRVAGVGGVLAFGDPSRRPELVRLRDELTRPQPIRARVGDNVLAVAREVLRGLHLSQPAHRLRGRLGLVERTAYRMPLQAARLRQAIAAGELHRFERWVRVDLHSYRAHKPAAALRGTLTRLRQLDAEKAQRLRSVERLCQLGAAASGTRGREVPLFRVPLLVEDRDTVRTALAGSGIGVDYIYDPPLDDYAGPTFAEPSPDPGVARWWAGHVLPLDPVHAERLLRLVGPGLRLNPAADAPPTPARQPSTNEQARKQ